MTVICQPAKKRGDPKVIAWLEAERDRCYISAIVIAQLAYCVRRTAGSGKTLQAWLTRLVDALNGRIHGFNVSVAHVWAERERLLEKAGQRMPVEDSYIAATARRHGLTIVTRNDRDFKRPGLKVFNPFKELR
jgi:predicted nucleic acid-binding protein